jgi:hypothetical protein
LSELYEEFSNLFEQDDVEEDEEEDDEENEEMDDLDMDMDMPADGGEDIPVDVAANAISGLIADLGLDMSDLGMEPEMDMDIPEEGEGIESPDFDLEAMAGEEEQLDEVFNVDPRVLRQEINRIKRLVREGKMDHHFGGKGGGKAGVDGAFGGKGKGKAGVKGAFGGGSEGKDAFVNPPQINKLNEAIRQLRRQNRAQSEKLNKYRGAVNSLREQLEDLNLFNAKLLYVNKLLQNKSLNES